MRSILVTGGNKGIGLAIVRAILEQHDDTFVFLGSRDLERGQRAADSLTKEHPDWKARIEVVAIDVSDARSVAAARARVAQSIAGQCLYGIVNNAGIGSSHTLAEIFEVNTLGVQRVCESFLPLLDPAQGRIVNVTSGAGPSFVETCSEGMKRFFLDARMQRSRLQRFIEDCIAMNGADKAQFAAKGLGDGSAYGLSKACANTYTLLLARDNPQLRINACTPGFIETDMTRGYAAAQGKSPAELGLKSASEGAKAPMFLLFGEPEGNGRYYGSDAQRSPLDRYRAPGSAPYTGD